VGRFSSESLVAAVAMLVSLGIGMSAREWARSTAAARLGDPTPRLWGRVSLSPRSWFEPFGSGVIPGLIGILWATGQLFLPAAYAKPAPIDPSYFRRRTRDILVSSSAGPAVSLILGVTVSFALPLVGDSTTAVRIVATFAYTNCALAVFHLLPIPGLDGARMVGLALPPGPAETYRNADKYLPFFVLLVLFLFHAIAFAWVEGIADAVCGIGAGADCRAIIVTGIVP
jgi:Zn-dependent protease